MAVQKDIDKWYSNFKAQMDAREIDIENMEDARRFRIPSEDRKSSVPLFPNGFTDTPKNRELLYDKAKKGEVFFFDKKTQDAFQLGSNSDKDCLVDHANAIGRKPEAPGAVYNLLNLLTLGLWEVFMGEQKEYDRQMEEYRRANQLPSVGGLTRLLNKLSFGLIGHDECMDYDRLQERLDLCHDMERVFRREEKEWRLEEEERQKQAEQKNSWKEEKNKETGKETEKIKDIDALEGEKSQMDGTVENPEAKGHMLKSQMSLEYERMKEAFGPNGRGWTEAMEYVNNIGKTARQLKNDPVLREAAGLSELDCQKIENMSRSMNGVFQRGYEAKAVMQDADVYGSKSPEEKQRYIKDLQAMNLVENTLINSAFAKNDPSQEGKIDKATRLINEMRKNPNVFRNTLDKMVGELGSTERMKSMSPEQISRYVNNTEHMMEEIKGDLKAISEQKEANKPIEKAKDPVLQNREVQNPVLQNRENPPELNNSQVNLYP